METDVGYGKSGMVGEAFNVKAYKPYLKIAGQPFCAVYLPHIATCDKYPVFIHVILLSAFYGIE
jgi:hypothetical protein